MRGGSAASTDISLPMTACSWREGHRKRGGERSREDRKERGRENVCVYVCVGGEGGGGGEGGEKERAIEGYYSCTHLYYSH